MVSFPGLDDASALLYADTAQKKQHFKEECKKAAEALVKVILAPPPILAPAEGEVPTADTVGHILSFKRTKPILRVREPLLGDLFLEQWFQYQPDLPNDEASKRVIRNTDKEPGGEEEEEKEGEKIEEEEELEELETTSEKQKHWKKKSKKGLLKEIDALLWIPKNISPRITRCGSKPIKPKTAQFIKEKFEKWKITAVKLNIPLKNLECNWYIPSLIILFFVILYNIFVVCMYTHNLMQQ